MVNGLSFYREPGFSISEHHTSVSVDSQEITHVALLRLAVEAIPALPGEHGQDMVSWLDGCHTLANALHNSA